MLYCKICDLPDGLNNIRILAISLNLKLKAHLVPLDKNHQPIYLKLDFLYHKNVILMLC